MLLRGTLGADGLYCFDQLKILQPPANSSLDSRSVHKSVFNNAEVTSVDSISTFNTWHHRLGHANSVAVKTVLQRCNIPFQTKSVSDFCSACCMGKVHRLHAPPSHTVHSSPFELVFTDLWGPSLVPSSCGYNYYIAFVDAHTKFTWIYFLKQKSEALQAFKQFLALIDTQFSTKSKALQSDWGGEFRPFTSLLTELGIVHRLSCPHTSHQNGTVERKHRQVVEMGITLLAHAGMPMKYWDHSFTTAVHLINRIPSTALRDFVSPYEALLKTKPDYLDLRTFGCACFPYLRPYNNHKLQLRSKECVYLGISPNHKGHKSMSPEGRIYVSKDVLFNEFRYPYNEIFLTSPPTHNPSTPFPAHIPLVPARPAMSPVTFSTPSAPVVAPRNTSSPAPVTSNIPSSESSPLSNDTIPIPSPPPVMNKHPMITRSKTGNLKPRVLLSQIEPSTVKQALSDPKWLEAMQAEYMALLNNQTWTLVTLPPHRKPIGCKWVFRVKENPDGSINKYKARLVAKGFHQQARFDFKETFSPVVKPVTIRVILTLALTFNWPVQQIDVNNAFLNDHLEEEVFMVQPPGFEASDKSLVCKLNKALYGLKQAPRAWYERLTKALLQFGFCPSRCDPSLFTFSAQGARLFVLVYVDDILITGTSSQLISDLIHKLNAQFALKELGSLDYFLGIEVKRLKNGCLLLNQSKYIRDLLLKANMAESKGISSPMVASCKLSRFGTDTMADPHLYRSVVGALQYATLTRPDITYSVNKVCQFMSNPLETHWKAVKRILRYLKGTIYHGLLLRPAQPGAVFSLRAYCDSDWATDPDDRRSTSGSCIFFGPNLVSWSAKKQQLVSRSSTEAEYRSMANTTSELTWIQSLLCELNVPTHTPTLLCDNLSAVMLSHNPILHSRTKHMELDIHFVREKVIAKSLLVTHVPSHQQIADALTKPLTSTRFHEMRDKLKVVQLPQPP